MAHEIVDVIEDALKKKNIKKKDFYDACDVSAAMYVDDLITKEQYKADYNRLTAQLAEASKPQQHSQLEKTRSIIANDFVEKYKASDRKKRRAMLLSIIDHIDIDRTREAHIFFKV